MNIKKFREDGYITFYSPSVKSKIKKLEKIFLKNYQSKFRNNKDQRNINLIKRVSGDKNVVDILHDESLLKALKKLKISYPIQSGPIITHYTSNNSISKSYGIPYHQDWPSMASSKNSVVIWFNINNFNKSKGHGIEVLSGSHEKIYKGKITNQGYIVEEKKLKNFKKEIIIPKYEILIMSSFLIHRSYINKKLDGKFWRLGISTRYDDLICKFNSYYGK